MEQLKLHISEEDFHRFQENKLSVKELENLLSHAASCTFCAGRLAESFEKSGLYRAPNNFSEAVLSKTKTMAPAPLLPVFSRKQQFCFYSAKICAAMAIALAVLFTLPDPVPSMKPAISWDVPLPARTEPSLAEKISDALNSAASNVNETMNAFISYHPLKEELD